MTKEEKLKEYIEKTRDLVVDENCSLDENLIMFEAMCIVAKDLLTVTMEEYQALQLTEQTLKDLNTNVTIHWYEKETKTSSKKK